MTPRLAIDPGQDGGLAWVDADGIVHAEKMPDGMTAQADRIRELYFSMPTLRAVMEKVGAYMPGNAGPGSCKFARHCGHLEAILYMGAIPSTQVAPQVWQAKLGALPKDKAERKRAIKELMARAHPHLTVTLATADALGILTASA
jgi:hypothetical protein